MVDPIVGSYLDRIPWFVWTTEPEDLQEPGELIYCGKNFREVIELSDYTAAKEPQHHVYAVGYVSKHEVCVIPFSEGAGRMICDTKYRLSNTPSLACQHLQAVIKTLTEQGKM